MPRYDYSQERIHILLPGHCIVTDWRIVEQRLPNLSSNFGRGRILDLRDRLLFRGSYSRTAVSYLSTHLKEIESHGESIAILDALEDLWKKDRVWRQRGVQSSMSTPQVFTALAQILSPEVFGCCETIFTLMSTFFTHHCEEIMRSRSPQWIEYVNALVLMDGGDPMPYFSCLVQHQKEVVPYLRRACSGRNCNPSLSRRTARDLLKLFEQKNDRNRQTIAGNPCGRRAANMVIKSGRGGHRHPRSLKNGLNYRFEDLLEAREEGRVYVNESDDDYSDSSSSSDDDDDYHDYHRHHYLYDTHHYHGVPRRIEHARYHNVQPHIRQGRLMHA